MAITISNLTSSTMATWVENVANYFKANAVPDYFDSIEYNTLSVSCIKGGKTLIKFECKSDSYMQVTFYANLTTISHRTTSSNKFIKTIYKCNNGFLLGVTTPGTSYAGGEILLTKDNNGSITLAYSGILNGSSPEIQCKKGVVNKITVINENTDSVAFNEVFYCNDLSCRSNYQTAIVPLPVCGSAGGNCYAPNAFLMPFTQVAEIGKIDINGVKYLTNGLWCIKDE